MTSLTVVQGGVKFPTELFLAIRNVKKVWALMAGFSRVHSGKLGHVWQRDVEYDAVEPTFAPFYYAQATPVTDGQRVVVSYGSAGLYCYDMDGKEQWRYDLGKLYHVWANASAPKVPLSMISSAQCEPTFPPAYPNDGAKSSSTRIVH